MSLEAPPRRPAVARLRPAAAFRVAAAVIALAMFASGVLSPLYDVYQAHWDFSTFTLTLVFAVYCGGVLASLLLLGRLSDEVGRRPVLLAALGGLILSTLLFGLAQSVAWLLLARLLQGAATGAALAAAAAALIDFHPDGDDEHAGFVNGLVSGLGMACGVLTSSLLVELAPAPRALPFAVLLALLLALLAAVCLLPESVERAARPRLRPARPHVPREARSAFVLASLGVLASWSVLGVLLALGPKLVHELIDGGGALAGGTVMFTTVTAATAASVRVRHADVRRATVGGSLVLALGMALMAASLSSGSLAALLAAGAVAGGGFGVAFLGALRALTRVVPEHHRAETMGGVLPRRVRLERAAGAGGGDRARALRAAADVPRVRARGRVRRGRGGVGRLAGAGASAAAHTISSVSATGDGIDQLVHRLRPAEGEPQGALVLLHGRGTDEHDLQPLADALDPQRRLVAVTPRGPLTIPGSPGAHWYVVQRVGFPDEETFAATYARLGAWLDALPDALGVPWSRTVLGGFSQGTAMSFALGLGPGPAGPRAAPAGILALSGFLPTVRGLEPVLEGRAGLPVALGHGAADPVIPVEFAHDARARLRAAGADLLYRETPGMAHTIDPAFVPQLREWVAARTAA